jgi:hypothetical protein
MGWNFFDISTLPRKYDIVWVLFPVDQESLPGPKLRPALVRATLKSASGERGGVVISYGTTKLKLGVRDKIDLVIQNAGQLGRLGLPAATRFDLDLMSRVPWAEEFFCTPPHSNDICTGHLDDEQIERLLKKLRRRDRHRMMPPR